MKGKIVNIYQDPITQSNLEGEAKLIKEYRPDEGDGLSMWIVEFLDEPGNVFIRIIYQEVTK